MSIITRLTPVLAKPEGVYNVDPLPVVGVDGRLVENVSFTDEAARMTPRPAVKPTMGQLPHVYGGKLRTVTFDMELKGSGDGVSAPEIGVFLRACGLSETITANVDVVYNTISTLHESITMYIYTDGLLYIMTGCRGNAVFNLKAGEPGKVSFTFSGHSEKPADVALPAAVTYSAIRPPAYLNAAALINGDTPSAFSEMTMDLQNAVTLQPDATASDGFGEIQIVDRDVIGGLDPEVQLVAAKDNWAEFRDGTIVGVSSGLWGTAAGNQISIVANQAHYRELGNSDNDGIRHHNIGFGFHESAGDDEIAIGFTLTP